MAAIYGPGWQAQAGVVIRQVAQAPVPMPIDTPVGEIGIHTGGNSTPATTETDVQLSEVSSFHSDNPGTPNTLRSKIDRVYDPRKQTMKEYQNMLQRQLCVMSMIGQAVPEAEVAVINEKAMIIQSLRAFRQA